MPSAPLQVFLADDSAPIRQRVAGLVGAAGCVVAGEAGTPRECIDGIVATRPDVVVLDVQLDGGNGLQVLRAVKAFLPRTVFVVFSNNDAPAYRKRYLEAGAACFLDKSTESPLLVAAIRNCAPDPSQNRSTPCPN